MFSFAGLVSIKTHYSSIELWNTHMPFESKESKKSLVFGNPKSVRSDEWLVSTTAMLGKEIKLSKDTTTTTTITRLISPWEWGYYLNLETGFSFEWNFVRFGSFLGVFLLLMLFSGSDFYLSLAGAFFLFFSSYNRWWDISSEITFFSWTLLSFLYFIFSRSKHMIGISFILLAIFGKKFAMTFYPAFQVPLSWLIIIATIGFWLDHKNLKPTSHHLKLKLSLFTMLIVGGLILIILWYIDNKEYLKTIIATVYPGRRISTGGDFSVTRLFSGYFDMFYTEHKFFFGNICESSSFILLFPIIILANIYKAITHKKFSYLQWLLGAYLLFLTFYVVWGIPLWIAQISLFSFVPASRAVIGFGFTGVLLLGSFLKKENQLNMPFYIKTFLAALSGLLVFLIGGDLVEKWPNSFLQSQEIILTSIYFSLLIICLLEFRLRKLFYIYLLLLVIVPSIGKNPISLDLNPIYNKKIIQFTMKKIKENPDALWIAYGNNLIPNFLKATGGNIFNGVQFPPNLKLMKILDNDDKNINIYNRYANITVHPNDPGKIDFELLRLDSYILSIHPCSPKLREIGIKYVVLPNNPAYFNIDEGQKCGLKLMSSTLLNNYWVAEFID